MSEPKRGDRVLVNNYKEQWNERIFIASNGDKAICVHQDDEGALQRESGCFRACHWDRYKPLPETQELTVAEISEKLGYDVKVVK